MTITLGAAICGACTNAASETLAAGKTVSFNVGTVLMFRGKGADKFRPSAVWEILGLGMGFVTDGTRLLEGLWPRPLSDTLASTLLDVKVAEKVSLTPVQGQKTVNEIKCCTHSTDSPPLGAMIQLFLDLRLRARGVALFGCYTFILVTV